MQNVKFGLAKIFPRKNFCFHLFLVLLFTFLISTAGDARAVFESGTSTGNTVNFDNFDPGKVFQGLVNAITFKIPEFDFGGLNPGNFSLSNFSPKLTTKLKESVFYFNERVRDVSGVDLIKLTGFLKQVLNWIIRQLSGILDKWHNS